MVSLHKGLIDVNRGHSRSRSRMLCGNRSRQDSWRRRCISETEWSFDYSSPHAVRSIGISCTQTETVAELSCSSGAIVELNVTCANCCWRIRTTAIVLTENTTKYDQSRVEGKIPKWEIGKTYVFVPLCHESTPLKALTDKYTEFDCQDCSCISIARHKHLKSRS